MTAVLVHPSQGKGDGEINAELSLRNPVRWADRPDLLAALVADQRMYILRRHGEEEARFWGTYDTNITKLKRVSAGDTVVFTGGGGIWALGKIGYQFKNPKFAEALWKPEPDKGVYTQLYSVAEFRTVDLPYSLLTEALGHRARNTFQTLVSYEGERADAVVAALAAA
ncbi:hypothetical protein [Cellulomonas endophytica]|uniref:hypothetical protein n=1 Tax=Cellulomonas endophytica TaxID=2494735 RepID=UPI00101333D2|nr:hypothetical protein [Cellulomonas endophytica]